MTDSTDPSAFRVRRIEQARGDGMGRALVLENKSHRLSAMLDDPGDVKELIEELERGLAWLKQRPGT